MHLLETKFKYKPVFKNPIFRVFSYAYNDNKYKLNKVTPGISVAAVSVISADYYSSSFGFFCRKELLFEKATKIPLRFRLGSMQQCDWLEGKPNAVRAY